MNAIAVNHIFSRITRYWRQALASLLALFVSGAAAQTTEAPDDQRSLSIYQIMVASFQHGEGGAPGYSQLWGPDGHTKNGNIRGVINALDHIAALGVNAIWLTPVFDSSEALGGEKLQATGYFTNDYFKIDPHFGTDADFRELVDSAHARGLYVILDGVFGHHGGVTAPSPSGHTLDTRRVYSDRGAQGGEGNVAFPGSLDYITEVATWWIENYGIDGWRLDQAYQATQNGTNYWNHIRRAVEQVCAARRARGEQWGVLGYMVGEDWGDADVVNRGVYRDGGLLSAFDFDGKELISGPMQNPSVQGLENGWADVVKILGPPAERGYLNDKVIPNLFLSNHDGYRVADHFDITDSLYYNRLKTLNAVLAAYPGPITLYFGDEYADRSLETHGGQPDNIARTSGHLEPRNQAEADLRDYIAMAMRFRRDNPAMWRGDRTFEQYNRDGANVLVVRAYDARSNNRVAVVFPDADIRMTIPELGEYDLEAFLPIFIKIE